MDSAVNTKAPTELCGAVVLKTARLFPAAHTGSTRHLVAGNSIQPASRLAIAQFPGQPGFYLYYCDDTWEVMTDTWHQTVEDAEAQAEFEYKGSSNAWVATNAV